MFVFIAMLNFAVHMPATITEVGSAVLKTNVEYGDLEALTPRSKSGKTQYWGQGSGFFVSSDGKVLTNYHVIGDAEEIVMVWHGTAYRMEAVAFDKDADLALLQTYTVKLKLSGDIDFSNYEKPIFPVLEIRKETECEVGNTIYVVGYPKIDLQGMEAKVTKGIVSCLSGFKGRRDTFQMDAAIQSGNSGGPVVDNEDKLVGVSVSTLFGGQNVNYAIKLSPVVRLLDGRVRAQPRRSAQNRNKKNIIKNAVDATVLILNYAPGNRSRPYDNETKGIKERNEAKAKYEKSILYARLLKVRKEWGDLKKLTDRLIKNFG